jgi:hypothetical protein
MLDNKNNIDILYIVFLLINVNNENSSSDWL